MHALKTRIMTTVTAIALTAPAVAETAADQPVSEEQQVPVSLTTAPTQINVPTINSTDAQLSAIRIVRTSIASASELVANKHGLSVQVSDAVRGNLSNLILTGDANEMMSLIGNEADISWFIYSGTLQVSAKQENVTRFIPTGDLSIEFIDNTLAASEINTDQMGLLHMPDSSAVRVSGPPKAVEIVEAVLSLAEEEAPDVVSDAIVVRRGVAKSLEIYGEAAAPALANAPAPQPTEAEEPLSAETTEPETEQSASDS